MNEENKKENINQNQSSVNNESNLFNVSNETIKPELPQLNSITQNIEVQSVEPLDQNIEVQPVEPLDQNIEVQPVEPLITPKQKPKNNVFSNIVIAIVFIILIGVVIGLPYINEYLENRKNTITLPVDKDKDKNKGNDNEPVIPSGNPDSYVIAKDTNIAIDKLNFTNFSLINENNEYYIQFDVKNNGNTNINLASKNIFIELHSESNTLLERIKLEGNSTGGITETKKALISFESYLNAKKISIVEKKVTDYPEIELKNDEQNMGTLTCKQGDNNIAYIFKDNKLISIKDKYSAVSTNVDDIAYQEKLLKYQNLVATYDIIDGVNATIASTTSSFTSNFDINLATVKDLSSLGNKYYYAYETIPKIVKFEMEAMRYTCSNAQE